MEVTPVRTPVLKAGVFVWLEIHKFAKKSHLLNIGVNLQMSLCPYPVLTRFRLHTLSGKLILQYLVTDHA